MKCLRGRGPMLLLVFITMFVVLAAVACNKRDIPAGTVIDGGFSSLDSLHRLSSARSRSISPENFTGEKGAGGMAVEGTGKQAAHELGQGWKVSPSVKIQPGGTFTLAEIAGPGTIQHIWLTPGGNWLRRAIIRFYWDDETEASVECPVGDFFACGLGECAQINSLAVCVNPSSGLNCYWPMPFRKKAKITMQNVADKEMVLYYQIDYALAPVPDDAAYLHAQFRREDPLKEKGMYTIIDGIRGKGHYVGIYMAWEAHSGGWWGEGEIKFFMDGDQTFPTICGTGVEDYFCGSYCFENDKTKRYQTYSTAYAGFAQFLPEDQIYQPGQRYGMYRWHITDPIRFETDLKVTIQALGWQSEGRYLQLDDDISSVCFWYQTEPHAPFPQLPPAEKLNQ